MSNFTRKIIDAMLPDGAAWNPEIDGDFDNYLDGQADNYDPIINFLRSISKIREPLTTPLLEELEREYGLSLNSALTEAQRRTFLNSYISQSNANGTPDEMQTRLQEGGFNVQVHTNDPAIDPNIIVEGAFSITAGSAQAFAGNASAFAKKIGGELIVNGDQFKVKPKFLSIANGGIAFAGNTSMFAGSFDELITTKIQYSVPTNPKDWPLVFFIGGDVVRDIDDKIVSIGTIIESVELRREYLKIIMKYKPLHSWAVSVVDFI